MSITILNPGMLTSVQDLGRIGYQQYGVSVSGVMDPRSASIANILVDNDEGEAVLECTMMGPHIRFDAPNIIAITGSDLGATLDGQSIDTYRAVPVNAGQTLRFTMLRTGCRAFVAFAGGLDIPTVMGSCSTDMKAKIGGYQGRRLQKSFADRLTEGLRAEDLAHFRRCVAAFERNIERIRMENPKGTEM